MAEGVWGGASRAVPGRAVGLVAGGGRGAVHPAQDAGQRRVGRRRRGGGGERGAPGRGRGGQEVQVEREARRQVHARPAQARPGPRGEGGRVGVESRWRRAVLSGQERWAAAAPVIVRCRAKGRRDGGRAMLCACAHAVACVFRYLAGSRAGSVAPGRAGHADSPGQSAAPFGGKGPGQTEHLPPHFSARTPRTRTGGSSGDNWSEDVSAAATGPGLPRGGRGAGRGPGAGRGRGAGAMSRRGQTRGSGACWCGGTLLGRRRLGRVCARWGGGGDWGAATCRSCPRSSRRRATPRTPTSRRASNTHTHTPTPPTPASSSPWTPRTHAQARAAARRRRSRGPVPLFPRSSRCRRADDARARAGRGMVAGVLGAAGDDSSSASGRSSSRRSWRRRRGARWWCPRT